MLAVIFWRQIDFRNSGISSKVLGVETAPSIKFSSVSLLPTNLNNKSVQNVLTICFFVFLPFFNVQGNYEDIGLLLKFWYSALEQSAGKFLFEFDYCNKNETY